MDRELLDALLRSQHGLKEQLSSLHGVSEAHAHQCAAAAQRLVVARESLNIARVEGAHMRLTHRLLDNIDTARKLLLGGGVGALGDCAAALEAVEQQVRTRDCTALAEAKATLQDCTGALANALAREWRAWLTSGGDVLWRGARGLALAPPGGTNGGSSKPHWLRAVLICVRTVG